jgi:hypothetical protein
VENTTTMGCNARKTNKPTLSYITNAPTCFGASAPPAGSFDIAFAKVIKIP